MESESYDPVVLTYREQTSIGKVHRLEVSPMLLSLRNMEDGRTSKPKHKRSRRRNSQGNPLAISLSTFLYSSHCLELLFSSLSSMRVTLNKFYRLESAYPHALFAIANAIDGSESFLLHHSGRYLLLSSF